jgi:hypothetical protein
LGHTGNTARHDWLRWNSPCEALHIGVAGPVLTPLQTPGEASLQRKTGSAAKLFRLHTGQARYAFLPGFSFGPAVYFTYVTRLIYYSIGFQLTLTFADTNVFLGASRDEKTFRARFDGDGA